MSIRTLSPLTLRTKMAGWKLISAPSFWQLVCHSKSPFFNFLTPSIISFLFFQTKKTYYFFLMAGNSVKRTLLQFCCLACCLARNILTNLSYGLYLLCLPPKIFKKCQKTTIIALFYVVFGPASQQSHSAFCLQKSFQFECSRDKRCWKKFQIEIIFVKKVGNLTL